MGLTGDELAALYLRVARALALLPDDSPLQEPVTRLLVDMLGRDGSALPRDTVLALAVRSLDRPRFHERLRRALLAHHPDLQPGTAL